MRLWMLSAGTIVAAGVMGVSLGAYVTRAPISPLAESAQAETVDYNDDTASPPQIVQADADAGPVEVHCNGCGPTLAERRWAKDMAGTATSSDNWDTVPEPVVDLDQPVALLPTAVASADTPLNP